MKIFKTIENNMLEFNKRVLCFYLILVPVVLIINCSEKCDLKNEKSKSKFEINTSIDTLNYIEIPGISNAKWIIHELGTKTSERSLGPTDFELYLYSSPVSQITREYICKNLEKNSDYDEGVPIDSEIYNALVGNRENPQPFNNNLLLLHGEVYNASPILKHLNSGLLILGDSDIFVRANTF